jgi:Flp pilus assembly protein TadB
VIVTVVVVVVMVMVVMVMLVVVVVVMMLHDVAILLQLVLQILHRQRRYDRLHR